MGSTLCWCNLFRKSAGKVCWTQSPRCLCVPLAGLETLCCVWSIWVTGRAKQAAKIWWTPLHTQHKPTPKCVHVRRRKKITLLYVNNDFLCYNRHDLCTVNGTALTDSKSTCPYLERRNLYANERYPLVTLLFIGSPRKPLGEMFIDWCGFCALQEYLLQQVVNDRRQKH